MAYCSNCGNLLEEGSNFCDQCGKKLNHEQDGGAQNNAQNCGAYCPPPRKATLADSIISMVLAILAMELSIFCFIPVVSIPFTGCCVALICVSRSKRTTYINMAIEENGFTKAANVCSIVAIPLTAFLGFIGLVATFSL